MKYTMKTPCKECPFLKGSPLNMTLPKKRLHGFAIGEFVCHKSAELREPDEETGEGGGFTARADGESVHCAGMLITLERLNRPTQMMRVAERLGLYDRSKLDMSADVDVMAMKGARL